MRRLKYFEAINEALSQALSTDDRVYLLGLGAPGPTGIFGTTKGLVDKFGPDRVMDMPSSEEGMTGIALGTTLAGYRPVIIHMRVDFSILAMNQMVNQVAKWHFMYGGKLRAPMVFRMIIGRGWGQGPQHSQSLQAWFAHVPGLRVVMPTTPHDVKGMLLAAIQDDAPVMVFEHRWLYDLSGEVPERPYTVSLTTGRVAREGSDVTIAATSYMVIEALRAAEMLEESYGIKTEVLDLRAIAPLDTELVLNSVEKTGALIVADTGMTEFGVGAEIVAVVCERLQKPMKASPRRVGLPHVPSPTTPSLANDFFPRALAIARAVLCQSGLPGDRLPKERIPPSGWFDTPDASYTGPY